MNENKLPSDSGDPDNTTELMLSNALQAPPVPSSLTRKIDQHFQSTWQVADWVGVQSSDDAESRLATTANRFRTIQRRAWPVVAALAGSLVLGFFVLGGSKGYAWASMLDAIAAQGVFQVGDEAVGQAVLESATDEASREKRTRQFVRVLLRQSGEHREYSVDGLRLLRQDWDREGDQIVLRVAMENARDEPIHLRLILDPDTSLPQSVQLAATESVTESANSWRRPALAMSYPSALAKPGSLTEPSRTDAVEPKADPDVMIATAPSVEPAPKPDSRSEMKKPDAHAASDLVATQSSALRLGEATKWGSVQVVHRSETEVSKLIDETLQNLWAAKGIQPVSRSSDEELLRRAYLDIAGRTPTVTEARHYLSDKDPLRYEKLLNKIVGSSDHASHLATTWRSHLIPEGMDLTAFGGREAFDRWLAERFEAGEPYDAIVRQLLLAEGRLSKSGPLLFYSAAKLDPDRLAGQTSRFFLGIRLECAQCHDHPFEAWSQEDFWSYAAFFARISRPQAELETVSTVMRVSDVDRGDVMLPETETIVPPRFLGQASADANSELENDPDAARRQSLATWLTSAQNPYFARATVNRIWSLMFGRGIVDPVDDFGTANPPISPELLDLLASQLIDSGFDLRQVTKTIAMSRAYQLSSAAVNDDAASGDSDVKQLDRLKHFAQMELKTLTAAQLYDCVTVATLLEQNDGGTNLGFQLNRFGNSSRDQFLQQFASPASNRIEYMAGIPQALTLMNGGLIGSATGVSTSGILKSLDAPFFTNEQRIEVLFLATLSRKPSDSEWELLRSAVPDDASESDRNEGLADILWALLNSAEFSLNH
ncbi:MAG: DUF1553 domain-containing protein [Pirellulaceae bacterium]